MTVNPPPDLENKAWVNFSTPEADAPDDGGDPGEAGDVQWLAMESAHGIEEHSAVSLAPGDVVLGDRGVHVVSPGKVIAIYRVANDRLEEDRPVVGQGERLDAGGDKAKELEDARLLLPMSYDARGKRHLSFEDGHKLLSEEQMEDWPLDGGAHSQLAFRVRTRPWGHLRQQAYEVLPRAKDGPGLHACPGPRLAGLRSQPQPDV